MTAISGANMEFEMQSRKQPDLIGDGRVSQSGVIGQEVNRDTIALARSGKKQVLTVGPLSNEPSQHSRGTKCVQRRFGLVSMTGFSCGLMCTWEGILVYNLPEYFGNHLLNLSQCLFTWLSKVRSACSLTGRN